MSWRALAPVAITPVGHYAYKITWSDGHDSGIYTFEDPPRALPVCGVRPRTHLEREFKYAAPRSRSAKD